jgi:2-polyprenyl-3-methyl-5-hydroxy-6-metoxy-1,4-benzoquinol methylase
MTPKEFDTAFYETRVSQKNPTSDNPEMTSLVDRIESWCQVKDGDRILDFGCYDGYILRRLSSRKQITGVGVDIAAAAVELANRLNTSSGLRFRVTDGGTLPFDPASFDVVVCSEILEHVPELDRVLGDIARVLVPGGRLYATMPNSLRDVWRPLHPLCRRIDEVEGHLRRMSRPDFLAAVVSHGFVPMRSRYRGFILSAIWYRNLIYTARVKALGIGLIGADRALSERLAKLVAYTAMRLYIVGDRPFSHYRRSMGIDAVFMRKAPTT